MLTNIVLRYTRGAQWINDFISMTPTVHPSGSMFNQSLFDYLPTSCRHIYTHTHTRLARHAMTMAGRFTRRLAGLRLLAEGYLSYRRRDSLSHTAPTYLALRHVAGCLVWMTSRDLAMFFSLTIQTPHRWSQRTPTWPTVGTQQQSQFTRQSQFNTANSCKEFGLHVHSTAR